MQIKVCGITQQEQVNQLQEMAIDYLGFIFYPKSKRYVQQALQVDAAKIKAVGVFVNPTEAEIDAAIQLVPSITVLQLHGNESPEFCKAVQKNFTIIKAIAVDDTINWKEVCLPYVDCCDYFLFDTKTESYGGSGNSFDWNVLLSYNCDKPFLLSGGISRNDIEKIKQVQHTQFLGVDINSKFETEPGVKNIELVKTFINKLS